MVQHPVVVAVISAVVAAPAHDVRVPPYAPVPVRITVLAKGPVARPALLRVELVPTGRGRSRVAARRWVGPLRPGRQAVRIVVRPPAGRWRLRVCAAGACRTSRTRVIAAVAAPAPALAVVAPVEIAAAPPPPPPPPPPPAAAQPPAPPPAAPAEPLVIRECGLPTAPAGASADAFEAMWSSSTLGWTGGDATFSAALPDGRELWLFGDTYVGGLRADGTRDPATPLVRNSAVVQDGDCLTTLLRGTAATPSAYIAGPATDADAWYWPNQPIVRGDRVLVLLTRMARTGPGPWDFAIDGSALATLALPDLAVSSVDRIPTPPGVYLGAAFAETAEATYVFGVADHGPAKELHVARVPAGGPGLENWRFWDGSDWSEDPSASAPIADGIGNQLSVLPDGEGWLLLTQPALDAPLMAFRAPDPPGPWTGAGAVTLLPSAPGAITYNALAHPELAGSDDLLVSVNLNAQRAEDLGPRPDLYRPRFVRVTVPPA